VTGGVVLLPQALTRTQSCDRFKMSSTRRQADGDILESVAFRARCWSGSWTRWRPPRLHSQVVSSNGASSVGSCLSSRVFAGA